MTEHRRFLNMRKHSHACTHAHTRAHARMHAPIHAQTHAQARARAHMHTHTHTHSHARMHAPRRTNTRKHVLARTCMHTHTHTHTHTHNDRDGCLLPISGCVGVYVCVCVCVGGVFRYLVKSGAFVESRRCTMKPATSSLQSTFRLSARGEKSEHSLLLITVLL